MDELCVTHTMSLFDWIAMASTLGVEGLEMYPSFFTSLDRAYLQDVREALRRHNLLMPMLCASPDFTQLDPAARRAAERHVILALENHYKDNYWTHPEFAQHLHLFRRIVEAIDSPWFGVNYDPSNAILAGEDPLEVLDAVKHRVVSMHASDRGLLPGHTLEELRAQEDSMGYAAILRHGEVGTGLNDYPTIFRMLRSAGFDGWVSIEDGMNGLDEIRRSADFLRAML